MLEEKKEGTHNTISGVENTHRNIIASKYIRTYKAIPPMSKKVYEYCSAPLPALLLCFRAPPC